MQPENQIVPTKWNTGAKSGISANPSRDWNYRQFFIRPLKNLDFIPDETTADAMARAVLGMLCSAVSEKNAGRLIRHLPNPLTVESLRGARTGSDPASHGQCVAEIARKFHIPEEHAVQLTRTVLLSTKCAVGEIILMEAAESLGEDWCQAVKGRPIVA